MYLERINQKFGRLAGDHNIKTKLLIATFFAALCLPVAARADDDKVYSGSGCVPEQGATRTDFVYPYGSIRNMGPSPATVNCLIVRDTNDEKLKEVRIRFNPGSNPDWNQLTVHGCGVWSFDPSVPPETQSPELLRFKTYINAVPLTLGAVSELTINGFPDGFYRGQYVLFCQVPPGATITSYFVKEPGRL